MKKMTYISTGHKLTTDKLESHEYFGEDFKKGVNTVMVFRRAGSASHFAVWSYGDWAGYGVSPGDEVVFEHSQTYRRVILTCVGQAHRDEDRRAFGGRKMAQWTLK